MIVKPNGIGTYSFCAETADENLAIAAMVEMMAQLAECGRMTDDEFNDGHSCAFNAGEARNFVFLPDRFVIPQVEAE